MYWAGITVRKPVASVFLFESIKKTSRYPLIIIGRICQNLCPDTAAVTTEHSYYVLEGSQNAKAHSLIVSS